MHKDLIATRLRQGAKLNPTGSQIKRIADNAPSVLEQAEKIEQHDDFLRTVGSTIVVARVLKPDSAIRLIEVTIQVGFSAGKMGLPAKTERRHSNNAIPCF